MPNREGLDHDMRHPSEVMRDIRIAVEQAIAGEIGDVALMEALEASENHTFPQLPDDWDGRA